MNLNSTSFEISINKCLANVHLDESNSQCLRFHFLQSNGVSMENAIERLFQKVQSKIPDTPKITTITRNAQMASSDDDQWIILTGAINSSEYTVTFISNDTKIGGQPPVERAALKVSERALDCLTKYAYDFEEPSPVVRLPPVKPRKIRKKSRKKDYSFCSVQ